MINNGFKILKYYNKKRGGAFSLIKHCVFLIKNKGFISFFLDVRRQLKNGQWREVQNQNGQSGFEHDPLISLIIVTYKSYADLLGLIPSLLDQSYKKFEILVIQNDDEDLSGMFNAFVGRLKFIKTSGNIGFAAANNIGVDESNGELVCLVNPDTVLDNDCLLNLVSELRHDVNSTVAVPKVRFYEKFFDLVITGSKNFSFDLKLFENSLPYCKWFLIEGVRGDGYVASNGGLIIIRVPCVFSEIKFNFQSKECNNIEIYPERNRILGVARMKIDNGSVSFNFKINPAEHSSAIWVINNAGSGLRSTGPYDIGFAEYDYGAYDQKKSVAAMCGCVAMIKREVLLNKKLFIDEFFAYYEDSEFSLRQSDNSIKYVPSAIVYHKHSSSSSEGSITWNSLVTRSRRIYESLNSDSDNIVNNFKYLNEFKYEGVSRDLEKTLRSYDEVLINCSSKKKLLERNKKTIAIYNSYWNTYGGGELHALTIAKALQGEMEVWLLSESDFDLDKLSSYFDINLVGFKKLVRKQITSELTSKFDVFVNSTYNSNLVSFAKQSFYVVSFPHPSINFDVLKSYKFIHNSKYTMEWAKKYWGQHSSLLVYPLLSFPEKVVPIEGKENIILSVGRFTPRGHAKRHDFILEAYKEISRRVPKRIEKIIFCGSLDNSSKEDVEYFDNLKKAAIGHPVEFYPNCDKNKLNEFYIRSRYYIHAAGVGVDCNISPEKLEHFGTSVFEAIYYGCLPYIYAFGGPAEMCKSMNLGITYHSLDELVQKFSDGTSLTDARIDMIQSAASKFIHQNNINIFELKESMSASL